MHSPSYSPASVELGRELSLLIAQPLEYYSSQIRFAAFRLNLYKIVCLEVAVLYSLVVDSVRNNVHGVSCEKLLRFILSEIAGVL